MSSGTPEARPRSTRHDRGLRAVERVRAVREQDNRLGMQQALTEQRGAEDRLAALETAWREHGRVVDGDTGRFVVTRVAMLGLREAIAEARTAVTAARVVAADATSHWRAAHSRLGAVEGLLDRRAEERAHDADRHEARELDDVAGRLWLRRDRAAGVTALSEGVAS